MSPPQRTGAFCRIPGVLGSTRPNQFLQSQRTVRESVSQLRPVPSGLRVQKSVSGGNTSVYIFSGSKVIAEYDNGAAPANPSREYIYSGGTLLAKVDSTGTYYYHQDHLSNRVVTDASGNVLAELGHFPFGESWYNGSGDKLMFTTYERDAETGNDYAQARQYVNGIARFSSLDPLSGDISDPQSLNRYSYVRNMPVMMVDPTGMWTCLPAASNTDDKQWAEGDFKEYLVSEEEADPPQNSCSYGWGLGGGGVGLDGVDITDDSGGGMGFFPLSSGSGVGESIIAATTPIPVNGLSFGNGDWWYHDFDFVFVGYFSMGDGQADGRGGGDVNFGHLIGQALVALLNPKCASLFGNLQNAVNSLANSTYSMYTPGEANPYPNRINIEQWKGAVNMLTSRDAIGATIYRNSTPGGIVFFTGYFSGLAPGFATTPDGFTQMTGFFHEQEHAANHNNAADESPSADVQAINENCHPTPVEIQRPPIPSTLVPPE